MGTRGYRVYRYKQRYSVIYSHYDSYPEALGEAMLAEARQLDHLKAYLETREMEDTPPQVDLFIEWVYEIDLDREIFHINHVPFFALNNLPPQGVDLAALVGNDSYGNKTCLDRKYSVYDEAVLRPYHLLLSNGQSSPYIDMLDLSEHITQSEMLRARYLQTIVGYSMECSMAFMAIQEFRLAKDRSEISDKSWHEAFGLASTAFELPIYFSFRQSQQSETRQLPERKDVCWVRKDVFIHITPHLTDENNMQAAIARVVEEVLKEDRERIVFGVLFSFFHCLIVRIDLGAGGAFAHTPPMPFLPSWFAQEPSTPGITALTRFGYRRDPNLFRKALALHSKTKVKSGVEDERTQAQAVWEVDVSGSVELGSQDPPAIDLPVDSNSPRGDYISLASGSKLPVEIWHRVALLLPSIDSLLEFGLVAKVCQEAAEMVLRCPHIDNWRLVGVGDTYTSDHGKDPALIAGFNTTNVDGSDTPSIGANDSVDDFQASQVLKSKLQCTKFLAIRDNSYAELWVGKHPIKNYTQTFVNGQVEISFYNEDIESWIRVFPPVENQESRSVPLVVQAL